MLHYGGHLRGFDLFFVQVLIYDFKVILENTFLSDRGPRSYMLLACRVSEIVPKGECKEHACRVLQAKYHCQHIQNVFRKLDFTI